MTIGKLVLNLKFDTEELQREVEIMMKAIGNLDNCEPELYVSGGTVQITGNDHCWTINLDDYITINK